MPMLPLVLIPGIQGRWEYMRATVDALSAHFQVLTFSLRGDTLDDYAGQVSRALDDRQIDRAAICGVSFGGLVALRFAASSPERTMALVVASTPALRTFTIAPMPLSAMAARARLIERLDMRADCARISAPTLVVTGESQLDHVVPVERSSEYVGLVRGARGAILERTGHAGTMTRPDAFATMVHEFVNRARDAAA
jgi:pimeloyl-ACP methyl ester carboxylesterase